jgi:hypothetical protein
LRERKTDQKKKTQFESEVPIMKLKKSNKSNSTVLREMVRKEIRSADSLSNSYVADLIKQTIQEVEEEEAAEGGEEEQQGGKDVEKAVDKLESSAMAPLFKKISNADEFEGLFKEFVNLAAQSPNIKKTAVKNILIKYAKQVSQQGKEKPDKEGEQA